MSTSQPPSSAPVQPGQVLAGKFRVERVLGAGGMGVVVAAMHLELEERVAVKFLHSEAMLNGEAGARFVREARAAVKIKSEHVARVIDVGRLENGAPYIVMEYLEGSDLSALIEKGALPIEDAVDYVIQACDAMAEAHALGIVHRDLKPANLFLTQRADGARVVKVLDFGISKVSVPDTKDAGLTKTSAVMGSPFYMSPEQMKSSRDVDARTDVWSLGVILYELLAGRPPFLGETLPELLSAIMLETPPPLQSLRPEVPPELGAVLVRALEKDRSQRYQSVGELAAALGPFAPRHTRHTLERVIKLSGGVAPRLLSDAPRSASNTAVAARTASAWSDAGEEPRRSSNVGLLIGIAAVCGLGAAAAALFVARSSAPTVEAPASAAALAPPAPAPPEPAPPTVASSLPIASSPARPEGSPPALAATSATPAAPPAPAVNRAVSRPAAKPAEKVAAAPPPAPPPPEPSPMVAPPPKVEPAPTQKRGGLQIDLK